jgi:signal transduction histidine kinase
VLNDEEIRGEPLPSPILEIYAPIRQTGSDRIIAVAAMSQAASELTREIRAAQYASYVLIASAATTLLIILFNLTGGLQRRIGELSLQEAADELFRKKVCRANGRVFEINEQNLRRLGQLLHAGPLQLTALALLKVDALIEPAVGAPNNHRANDVEAIRHALKECLKQIRDLSASLVPSELDGLSFAEAIKTAVCLHELRTATPVACDLRDLPQSAPDALKACAYQFVSQGLTSAFQHSAGGNVELRASGREKLEIELSYEVQRSKAAGWLTQDLEDGNVRHRIEALGGSLLVRSEPERRLRITAEFGAYGLGRSMSPASPL